MNNSLPSEVSAHRHYRVYMRTVPGMYAQYDGHVDVWSDGEELFLDAVRQLRRTSFKDYSADMWRMTGSELLS